MEESIIWTEKYRPKDFSDIMGQEDIVKRIKAFVTKKNMPHILFCGPAGVGKSSLSLVIARQLFGESWKSNFLELNASDERGIDVVRVKVKDFARTRAMGEVPFKIIFLDECDALTREAQQALRRTMENYTSTTRFILSANYSSKIIDPIQSRCAVFHFKPLAQDQISKIIEKISINENITIEEDAKIALAKVSRGDCRKVENILQSAASIDTHITQKQIFELAATAHPEEIKKILTFAFEKKFIQAKELLMDTMNNYGLSGLDVIKQFAEQIWNLEIEDVRKLKAISQCGEIEFRMVEGSDEFLQLEAFIAHLATI